VIDAMYDARCLVLIGVEQIL